jgi:hypothetical protein
LTSGILVRNDDQVGCGRTRLRRLVAELPLDSRVITGGEGDVRQDSD